jgi:predicted metal-dependent RNase
MSALNAECRRIFKHLIANLHFMTTLTFYGAVNEIGGNKILLEDKDAKLFLDFGMSFGQANSISLSFYNQENTMAWATLSHLVLFQTSQAFIDKTF